jgi:hypothetical protein
MKKGKTNWELVIEWFDEDKYSDLPETDKKILNGFRKKVGNINQLTKTIDRDRKKVIRLEKDIRERENKVRLRKNEGKELYKQVEFLKKQHHVSIYYNEGKQNRSHKKTGKDVQYDISNLKIKSQYIDTIKTISLKPTRIKNLEYLRPHFPNWIESLELTKINRSKYYWKNHMIEFFKPTIERVFNQYPEELRHGSYKLNLDKLIEEKKKDMGV